MKEKGDEIFKKEKSGNFKNKYFLFQYWKLS
jgi:hypothetical protein